MSRAALAAARGLAALLGLVSPLTLARAALAQQSDNVSTEAISVPKGEGTIEGMGESFSAQPSTGIATFSVPIRTPKARGGAQPSLKLEYSSAGGGGNAGVGWSVSVPYVSRQTDRGLPAYQDPPSGTYAITQDRFVFNGGQELVPLGVVAGGACPGAPGETFPGWADGWQYFRPRVEGTFMRFLWSPNHQTWRVFDKSGLSLELGAPLDGSGRTDPLETSPTNASQIFRWNLARAYDDEGPSAPLSEAAPAPVNVVQYAYVQSSGLALLSDVYDTPPATGAATAPVSAYANHAHFVWVARTDPSFSFKRGWETQSMQVISRVDVSAATLAGGTPRELLRRYDLAYAANQRTSLLTTVTEEGRCATPVVESSNGLLPYAQACPGLPPMSFTYTQGGRPGVTPKSFQNLGTFDTTIVSLAGAPTVSLSDPTTDVFDVDGDSLPDVIRTEPTGAGQQLYFNGRAGASSFAPQTGMTIASGSPISLASLTFGQQVLSFDADGDALVNLVYLPNAATSYIASAEQVGSQWQWAVSSMPTPTDGSSYLDLGQNRSNIRIMDVNADGLVDIVETTTEVKTFFNLGRYPGGFGHFGTATWASPTTANLAVAPASSCLPTDGSQAVDLSSPQIFTADMNGDGVVDLVRAISGTVEYWPGLGNGWWGVYPPAGCPGTTRPQGALSQIPMTGAPSFGSTGGEQQRFVDLNRDGYDDLIDVQVGGVKVYFNLGGTGFSSAFTVSSTPNASNPIVRTVDVDASGTLDILWGATSNYQYLDVLGGTRPHLLTQVNNGLGRTTTIAYSTSSAMMLAAAAAGQPWASTMPVSHSVLAKVVESDNLPVAGRAADTVETDYTYRDAVYDGRQREFRGFRQVSILRTGDQSTPPSTTTTSYLTGDCVNESVSGGAPCDVNAEWMDNPREALKGLAVDSETHDQTGIYLSTEHTTYTLDQLYTGLDGRVVRRTFPSATDTWSYDTAAFSAAATPTTMNDVVLEGGAIGSVPASAITLRSTKGRAHTQAARTVDAFGDLTLDEDLGCVDGCTQVDEAILREAVFGVAPGDSSGWLLRSLHSWTQGSATPPRHEQYATYDDRGHLRVASAVLSGVAPLQRSFAEPGDAGTDAAPPAIAPQPTNASASGTIPTSARDLDSFGNVVFERSADNMCRTIAFDAPFAALPVTESVYVGAVGNDQGGKGSVASAAFASAQGGSGCGATALSATAVYDRGLQKETLVTDVHGELTTVIYDGLGRLSALYRPDPATLGISEASPSLTAMYNLDPTGVRPYSMIDVTTLAGASIAGSASVGTHDEWQYVDGYGRVVVSLSQADRSAGDLGAWIVQGLTAYDSKGNPRDVYLPWFSNASPSAYPLATPPTTAFTQHLYDAFQREYETIDPASDVVQQLFFRAVSVDRWDAADLDTASPHYGTYGTVTKDGHGRTIQTTDRFHNGSALASAQTQTQYLATGEVTQITRSGGGGGTVARWMAYDSLGHMVENVDPHTTRAFAPAPGASGMVPLLYEYDDAGHLVGTSDARGCGVNFFYDAAGREVAEDYSPCETTQPAYTAPNLKTGDGTEVFKVYDVAAPTPSPDCAQDAALLLGRVSSVADRGSLLVTAYDPRGRVTCASRQIATPGTPARALASRYATNWFSVEASFDEADRPMVQSTGATASPLLASDGTSNVTTTYTARGTIGVAGSSYGALVGSVVRDANGLIDSIVYGDLAGTTTALSYDAKLRVQTVTTSRKAPALWTKTKPGYTPAPASPPSSLQTVLESLTYGYDDVDDPTSIADARLASEWPAGAQPVSRTMTYDDLYRLTSTTYAYPASSGDPWTSPFQAEDTGVDSDPRRGTPAPHVSFADRVEQQSFTYDALGDTTDSEDDAHGFYDRSLGTITSGASTGRPYQLASATDKSDGSASGGHLSTAYDDAGNLVGLSLVRSGTCLPAGADCAELFAYEWDEVGHLTRARRWDYTGNPGAPGGTPPPAAPAAELRYAYDGSGARVLKSLVPATGAEVSTVYASPTLELRGTTLVEGAYQRTDATEVPYLFAHGVLLGRVAYALESVPSLASGSLHVYLELPDRLGSTSVVIDHDTSELVEATTYMPYGAAESDYRPQRWESFREDDQFTGKEEDIEVGLQYFGQRYLAPRLGRWMSADPLAVHEPGQADLNLYAYVHGRTLRAVDPTGLDDEPAASVGVCTPKVSDEEKAATPSTDVTLAAKAPGGGGLPDAAPAPAQAASSSTPTQKPAAPSFLGGTPAPMARGFALMDAISRAPGGSTHPAVAALAGAAVPVVLMAGVELVPLAMTAIGLTPAAGGILPEAGAGAAVASRVPALSKVAAAITVSNGLIGGGLAGYQSAQIKPNGQPNLSGGWLDVAAYTGTTSAWAGAYGFGSSVLKLSPTNAGLYGLAFAGAGAAAFWATREFSLPSQPPTAEPPSTRAQEPPAPTR